MDYGNIVDTDSGYSFRSKNATHFSTSSSNDEGSIDLKNLLDNDSDINDGGILDKDQAAARARKDMLKAEENLKTLDKLKEERTARQKQERDKFKNVPKKDVLTQKVEDFLENDDSDGAVTTKEDKSHMRSNLKIRSWSVASYDTCSGDAKRTFAAYFGGNVVRWVKDARSLAVFKSTNDEDFEVPMHVDSDYEDDEPYGPHDPDSPFYKSRTKKKSTFSRLRRFTSFGSKGSADGSRRSKSRVQILSKMFGSSKKEGASFSPPIVEAPKKTDMPENKEKEKNDENANKKYIPVDMEWDEALNDGAGGLRNKKPQIIPTNKIWSKDANNGKGGLVNKPPPANAIPPGKIWSTHAFNGQGGLVNVKPKVTPEGQMWDYEADDGMGGFVPASEEYLEKLKAEKRERKERRKKRKEKEKLKRSKTKIRGSKTEDESNLKNTSNSLLRNLAEENEAILAKLDEDEKRLEEIEEDKAGEVVPLEETVDEKVGNSNQQRPVEEELSIDGDESVILYDDNKELASASKQKATESVRSRRKSIVSVAKEVVTESLKTLRRQSRKMISLRITKNKDRSDELGISQGHVLKMYNNFETESDEESAVEQP